MDANKEFTIYHEFCKEYGGSVYWPIGGKPKVGDRAMFRPTWWKDYDFDGEDGLEEDRGIVYNQKKYPGTVIAVYPDFVRVKFEAGYTECYNLLRRGNV